MVASLIRKLIKTIIFARREREREILGAKITFYEKITVIILLTYTNDY